MNNLMPLAQQQQAPAVYGRNLLFGNGAPEAVVSAEIGTSYFDVDTGSRYFKATGSSTTGWVSAIGYTTGAGGAVAQITNRSTGVTLSKITGQITTDTSSLAAETAAVFTVTNTLVAIGDVIVLSQQSGSNGGNTAVGVTTVAAGSFAIKVSNNNASGGTAETGAIIINFAVIKAVAA